MTNDMTQGKPWKLILLFSLPIMLGNLLQQLYSTVDSLVVGNYVSEAALSAVGTCATLTGLFVCFAVGFSTGSSVVVAQYFGAKQIKDMRRTVSTVFILVVGLGAVLAVLGFIFARPLLAGLVRVPDVLLDMAVTYFRIYCIGLIFQFSYNIIAAIVRALGDSKATLMFLIVASALNIGLDIFSVTVLNMGIAGVALATVIAQAGAAGVSLWYMMKHYPDLRFRRDDFVFDGEKCRLALKMAIPTTVQQCVVNFSNIFMQRLVNSMSLNAIAAYTVGVRLESYIVVPIGGFHMGEMTYVAQNIGAGKPDRIVKGWRATELMGIVVCLAFIGIICGSAKWLVGLFNLQGESLELGVQYLRGMVPCFTIFSLYMMSTGVLQGSGDMIWGAGLTTGSLVSRLFFTYMLYYFTDAGFAAFWRALPISWGAVCIIAFLRYKQGKWREKAIVNAQQD